MSKVIKVVKKPVTIEAIKWDKTGRCQGEMARFIPSEFRHLDYSNCATGDCPELYIVTLEGNMHVSEGDYVIKGVNGEFYPCKSDIFEETYDYLCKCGEKISFKSIGCIYCKN